MELCELKPLSPYQALLLRKGSDRILIVADLHIGWEVSLSDRGIHIPSQTSRMLEKLAHLIKSEKPTSLVLLGDVKHAVSRVELEEWRDVPDFFDSLLALIERVEVVPGNHDGNLEPLTPSAVKIHDSSGLALWGTYGLFHGHAWPSIEVLSCKYLIMGHTHPVILLRDVLGFRAVKQVWVKAKCDSGVLAASILNRMGLKVDGDPKALVKKRFGMDFKDPQCVIMPSLNDFLGGQPINLRSEKAKGFPKGSYLGPVLRSGGVSINEGEVYLLDGTFLGSVEQLRRFS